jgi:CspA family cold shock protein
MPVGTVKKWFDDRGFGFLTENGGPPDIFVHASEVARLGLRQPLRIGERVSFEIAMGHPKGPKAINLKIVE